MRRGRAAQFHISLAGLDIAPDRARRRRLLDVRRRRQERCPGDRRRSQCVSVRLQGAGARPDAEPLGRSDRCPRRVHFRSDAQAGRWHHRRPLRRLRPLRTPRTAPAGIWEARIAWPSSLPASSISSSTTSPTIVLAQTICRFPRHRRFARVDASARDFSRLCPIDHARSPIIAPGRRSIMRWRSANHRSEPGSQLIASGGCDRVVAHEGSRVQWRGLFRVPGPAGSG